MLRVKCYQTRPFSRNEKIHVFFSVNDKFLDPNFNYRASSHCQCLQLETNGQMKVEVLSLNHVHICVPFTLWVGRQSTYRRCCASSLIQSIVLINSSYSWNKHNLAVRSSTKTTYIARIPPVRYMAEPPAVHIWVVTGIRLLALINP